MCFERMAKRSVETQLVLVATTNLGTRHVPGVDEIAHDPMHCPLTDTY